MSYSDLKLFQSCIFQKLDGKRKDLCIGIHGTVTDELGTGLGTFFQSSLIAGIVDECISAITEPQRNIFIHVIFGCAPCDGWCDIRSQYQCISFPVKKFIQIFGWRGTDLFCKYIKKFKGRSLNRVIAILLHQRHDVCLEGNLSLAFFVVNIPYTLWGM